MIVKNVCCIGAGFIGGTFSSVIAFKCPGIEVHVLDKNEEKIEQWKSGRIPVFEPDLEEMVQKCRNKNLYFTTDSVILKKANIIFVCLEDNTKFLKAGDIKVLEDAIRLMVNTEDCSKIVVQKSTVALLAIEVMSKILKAHEDPYRKFPLISNPDSLAEGWAVSELLNPERVLIGGDGTPRTLEAFRALSSIYEKWVPKSKIITTDMWSAQLSNLAQAAFLAQITTVLNSIAELCELMDADIMNVIEAVSMDSRIGVKNLKKYFGLKAINFSKSIKLIMYLCHCLTLPEVASYWQKLLNLSEHQKQKFATKVLDAFSNSLEDRGVAILGLPLKYPQDSAGIYISKLLLKEEAKLKICNLIVPAEVIMKDLANLLCDSSQNLLDLVEIFSDPYEAATGAEAIIVCTDFPKLMDLDFLKIYNDMKKPAYIFDGNNVLQHEKLQEIGFQVQTLGKKLAPTVLTEN